jgi:hypothetical protein
MSGVDLVVLVCGGRTFDDWYGLCRYLDAMHKATPIGLLIHGAAPGADTLAETWAGSRGVPTRRFIAYWHADGKAAGPMRNRRMLLEGKPNLIVAFPGKKGTSDMMQQAREAGVRVVQAVP